MARVEHDELTLLPARRREVLDGGERDGVVVAPGEDERGDGRVGLRRMAAAIVEERDREWRLALAPVVVDGSDARGAPARDGHGTDARLPAVDEPEGRREEDEAAHAVGMALGGERGEIPTEARAEEHAWFVGEQGLDDREHARDRQMREVGCEIRNLERRAQLGEPGAEELRLRAARAGGEAVKVKGGAG